MEDATKMSQCIMEMIQEFAEKRTVYAGVGNILKRDDGVGVFITQNIKGRENVIPLTVEVSIENYIGKIKSIDPETLVIIDAVDFGEAPGYYKLIKVNELMDATSNTHNISLRQLEVLFSMPVYVLGIQPSEVCFGEGLTDAVYKASRHIIRSLNKTEVKHAID